MRWVLIVVGALVAVGVLMAIVGAMLPQGHVASRGATLQAAPEAVWEAISSPAAYTTWRPDVQSVDVLPDRNGHRMWREKTKDGTVTYEALEWSPPTRLSAKIADEGLPYGGTWTWEVSPAGSGTRVTITERGEVYNPLFRFLARFVFGYTATMEKYLRALGSKFGERVTPEPAGAA